MEMREIRGIEGAERGHRGTRRRNSATVMAVETAGKKGAEKG